MLFFGQKNFEHQQHHTANEMHQIEGQVMDSLQPGERYVTKKQQHQQPPPMTRAQREQADLEKNQTRKCLDVSGKVLISLSIGVLIIGIAMLVFGIVKSLVYLYVPGAVLIVLAFVGFALSILLIYLAYRKPDTVAPGGPTKRRKTDMSDLDLGRSMDRRTDKRYSTRV
jgi:hypothetical protein